jgi:ATP-binding cassette, subfamily B, bacterial
VTFRSAIVSRFRRAGTQLAYLPDAVAVVRRVAPGWTVLWLVVLVLMGLIPGALVYLAKDLVDALVAALAHGTAWEYLQPFLFLAALVGVLLVLLDALSAVSGWIGATVRERVRDELSALIHGKALEVDYAFFEQADYHDNLHRARAVGATHLMALLERGGASLTHVTALAAIAVVLLPFGWWLPLALAGTAVPVVLVLMSHQWRLHRFWMNRTQDRRWLDYYDWMLTLDQAAAEMRIYALGDTFREAYRTLRSRLRGEELALERRHVWATLGASAATLVVSAAVLAFVAHRVLSGHGSLGEFALFYQAFSRGRSAASGVLTEAGAALSSLLYLGSLFDFLALKPAVLDPPRPRTFPLSTHHHLGFNEVTFAYPGSERPALQNFSLQIPAGRITAVVGGNGAGKSTLINLLCRFYDPQEGCVSLDGTDIRLFRQADLRAAVCVLFQHPVSYRATAGESIALGNMNGSRTAEEIERAARAAGAHDIISRLPHGYDTLLGKWFADGVELSSGEHQRIALARAFLRPAPIVLLDEPTSFMDPWAEADWIARLRTLLRGRTVLLITHRFTTALHADVINVMFRGRIVETGSHRELIAAGGFYASSWAAQTGAHYPAGPSAHPTPAK